MTFDAREATAAAEANYAPFQFIGLDGEAYYLPHPMMVNPGLARRAQAGEITNDQLLAELAPDAAKAIEAMLPVVQRDLVKAWRAAVDPDMEALGKELEPPSPTQPSGARSKPSSRSGVKTSGPSRSGE